MGTLMNGLSILGRVRSVRSAAVCFLVNFGCAISRACGKKGTEQSRFPCITFCEDLVPDAEPPFLRLANVEVPNNHPKDFRTTGPMENNATLPSTKVSQDQVGLKVHVDDYQNVCTIVL